MSNVPADSLAAYGRLVATIPGLERKGANLPYTSLNGNMFSFLADDGSLALRLSPIDRASFIAEHEASLHEAHGHVMKEYVTVPASVLADTTAAERWFAASWAYAQTLKPKPSTRKPKG